MTLGVFLHLLAGCFSITPESQLASLSLTPITSSTRMLIHVNYSLEWHQRFLLPYYSGNMEITTSGMMWQKSQSTTPCHYCSVTSFLSSFDPSLEAELVNNAPKELPLNQSWSFYKSEGATLEQLIPCHLETAAYEIWQFKATARTHLPKTALDLLSLCNIVDISVRNQYIFINERINKYGNRCIKTIWRNKVKEKN